MIGQKIKKKKTRRASLNKTAGMLRGEPGNKKVPPRTKKKVAKKKGKCGRRGRALAAPNPWGGGGKAPRVRGEEGRMTGGRHLAAKPSAQTRNEKWPRHAEKRRERKQKTRGIKNERESRSRKKNTSRQENKGYHRAG